MVKLTYTFPLL